MATTTALATRADFGAGLAAVTVTAAALAVGSWTSTTASGAALQLIQSLLAAPLIEELFFRGVVQSQLRARGGFWGQRWTAIGLTAVCFGLAHLVYASIEQSLLVMAPAFLIGWAYERFRSIGLCIGLHSAANAFWIGFWSI